MINRYSITGSPYQFSSEQGPWEPRYNACPTQALPVLIRENQVAMFNWGMMVKMSTKKATSAKLFNTSSSHVFSKASTRAAMKDRRCVILADGVFLWKQIGKKKQTPYYFYQDNQQMFGMAGYWESSEDLEGNEFKCFMLITGTHRQLASTQEETPIFINTGDFKTWLDPNTEQAELENILSKSASFQFASHSVSPEILNEEKNHADLIRPSTPSDQHGNYTLF